MRCIATRNERPVVDGVQFAFRVYASSPSLAHQESLDHASGLDADVYNLTSRHFVLIARSGRHESVVGTLRMTSQRRSNNPP